MIDARKITQRLKRMRSVPGSPALGHHPEIGTRVSSNAAANTDPATWLIDIAPSGAPGRQKDGADEGVCP